MKTSKENSFNLPFEIDYNELIFFPGTSDVDYSKYPSKEHQLKWLRVYLEEFRGSKDIAEDDLETLYKQVNKFALASHYMWAIWALIQTEHSYLDYDFIG